LSEKTVAANVLKWGTGAINVDACRVATEDKIAPRGSMDAATDINAGWARPWMADSAKSEARLNRAIEKAESLGRWPANIVLDGSDEVLALFPESKAAAVGSVVMKASSRDGHGNASAAYGKESRPAGTVNISHGDSGSAARFFYSAKADADDRLGSKHPTVKPVDLMRWLCRLVTPPGGTILDPFSGTGTTGEAAWREGFNAVLIEREAEYCADIARRMALCAAGPATRKHESMKARQGDKPQDCGPLFGGTDHAGGGENLSPHISVRRSKT
jgi:site-specific DNA-methyltransferase (adenine-specific)